MLGVGVGFWKSRIEIFYWVIKTNWRLYPGSRYQIEDVARDEMTTRSYVNKKNTQESINGPENSEVSEQSGAELMEVQNWNNAIGSTKPIGGSRKSFLLCYSEQWKKQQNKHWEHFTHPIQDYCVIVFMMELLLAIELPNNELEEEGLYRGGGKFLEVKAGWWRRSTMNDLTSYGWRRR